ncbi:SCO family protein [Candidatus Venteria ishoeyi]|uniref:SCO1/SenC n=1 Tax=Candidatus Venteria ishoeyi TaxID=1899563 RepID=A0A1H6F9N1_9GAMM|nr:SCO family protein [Candidatus Venteria ishoeyi]SEH06019.1 SCO1/SenC [Candidatus Venteria ishoeyi]
MPKTRATLGGLLILLSFSLLFVLPLIPLHSGKIAQLPFVLEREAHFVLVFFGYPGCNEVCPRTLQNLTEIYQNYSQQVALQVVFINLHPGASQVAIQAYAKNFHPHFQGVNLTDQILENLKSNLGVTAIKTMDKSNDILHSEQLYLLEKYNNDWKIKVIYRNTDKLRQGLYNDMNS